MTVTEEEVEEVLGEICTITQFAICTITQCNAITNEMQCNDKLYLEQNVTGRMFTNCGDLQLPAEGFGRGLPSVIIIILISIVLI